jgi:hypothetical protein
MKRLIGIACCAACAACTSVQSTDLKTAGISAQMALSTTDSTGTTSVNVTLNVDDNATDFVELTPGDTLTAALSGQSETLSESNVAGLISYGTNFSQVTSGATYTVAFNRPAGNTSAPSSTGAIPAAFELGTLSTGSFSRANDTITVTYSGSDPTDPMAWTLEGDCFNLVQQTLSGDPGTFTIAKGTVQSNAPSGQQPQSCQATLTLSRTRQGTLDPAYYGGGVSAQQVRSLTFTSAP